jgi:hypothetical protein
MEFEVRPGSIEYPTIVTKKIVIHPIKAAFLDIPFILDILNTFPS